MIELIAMAPDGWAFAHDGDTHWLLRPPYRKADRERIARSGVERSLLDEDFSLHQQAFDTWGGLTRFVADATRQAAPAGRVAASFDAAARVLMRATSAQAERHLAVIQSSLDSGSRQGAEDALHALLGAPSVQNDAALVARVADLLKALRAATRDASALTARQKRWPVRDDTAVESVAARVRERGSLLAPAS